MTLDYCIQNVNDNEVYHKGIGYREHYYSTLPDTPLGYSILAIVLLTRMSGLQYLAGDGMVPRGRGARLGSHHRSVLLLLLLAAS